MLWLALPTERCSSEPDYNKLCVVNNIFLDSMLSTFSDARNTEEATHEKTTPRGRKESSDTVDTVINHRWPSLTGIP